jgi:hypothetical protein
MVCSSKVDRRLAVDEGEILRLAVNGVEPSLTAAGGCAYFAGGLIERDSPERFTMASGRETMQRLAYHDCSLNTLTFIDG